MRPFAHPNGFDARGLADQLVPGIAAMIDYFSVEFEDVIGKPIISHELPNFFDGVELWAFLDSSLKCDG
jgi:hypothetical protein